MAIRKIFVGFDGSPSAEVALDCALTLASRQQSKILGMVIEDERRFVNSSFLEALATVTGLSPNVPSPLPPNEMLDTIERVEKETSALENEFNSYLAERSVDGDFLVERSNVVATLSEHGQAADLICLGRSGAHVGVPQVKDGSSLLSVIKRVSTPVLATSTVVCPMESVLLGFDGSDASFRALKFILEIVPQTPDSKLLLVTVASEISEANRIQAPAIEYLADCQVAFESVHLKGTPSEELLQFDVTFSPDIVAVGAFSSGVVSETLWGSTTEAIVAGAQNAVLLVP